MTTEQEQEDAETLRGLLRKANLGPRVWNNRLPNYGEAGNTLRAELVSGVFNLSFDANESLVMYGERQRVDVFSTLAREMVLYKFNLFFTSLKGMLNMLTYDDRVETLYQAGILFISDFYDDTITCPFQGYERANIEEVLNWRLDEQRPIYVCSSTVLEESKGWWSQQLLQKLSQQTRGIYIGKSVNRN